MSDTIISYISVYIYTQAHTYIYLIYVLYIPHRVIMQKVLLVFPFYLILCKLILLTFMELYTIKNIYYFITSQVNNYTAGKPITPTKTINFKVN